MRVLTVDDDPIQRKLLRVTLASAGHTPVEAQDGVEALEVLRSGGFGAVITDILMPRMDGYRLCVEIRRDPALFDVPILVYTSSYTSPSDERVALHAGADIFLRKPADRSAVLEALDRVVRLPRREKFVATPGGELETLKQYSESLVRKLEDKNVQLEAAHDSLVHAHDELSRSEEQVRLLLDSTAEGIYGLDVEGRITFCNKAALDLLGFRDPKELIGKSAHAWFHHTRADGTAFPRETCEISLTLQDGQGHSSADDVFWRSDATRIPVEFRSYPIRKNGDLLGAVVTFSDISERKRIQDALRKSERRFSLAFHASPVATSISEAATSLILDVNDQFLRSMDYTREEIIGRTSVGLGMWAEEDVRREIAEVLLRDGSVRDRKTKLRTRTGELRDVVGSIVRVDLGSMACFLTTFVDVTERQRAEESLLTSERRVRALMENAKDAIVVSSLEGAILEVNRAAEELYGRERADLLGRTIAETVPEDERESVGRSYQETLANKAVAGFETRVLRPDGRTRPIEVSASVVEIGGGTVVHAILRDVSDRHRAQVELKASEERYRLLFDANPLPMWVFDEETLAFLAVNDAACRHYGFAREEFLRMTIQDIRPAEDRQKLEKALRSEPAVYQESGVWRHRRKNGSIIEVEITSNPIVFDARPAQLILALDVTTRRLAEEGLRKSEERYRQLFERNLAGVVRATIGGRILDCNDSMARIYGYASRAEAMEHGSSDFYANPAERLRLVDRLRREKSLSNYEVEGRRKDGSSVWLLCNYSLVAESDGDEIQGTIFDLTEKRRLEEQLRQSQKMEAVGLLAGGIAHDFNNILTTILGYGGLALERIDKLDPLFEEISEIQSAGERAAELTRKLLAFSRKQILEPRVMDLNATVAGMERMLRRTIGEDVQLLFHPASDLGHVRADPGQVEQVLLNLAVNARDAMPKGGSLTIETANVRLDQEYARTHSDLTLSGEVVLLAMSDSGSGMDEATQSRIFEPFFTTKELGKGTGLGLSTVYGIVRQSGGHISCYSELGVGTSFKVYLPRVAEEVAVSPVPVGSSDMQGSETLLVVEDEETLATLARRALERRGYRVLVARSGAAAQEIAQAHPEIELLLTDVVMPGMSGPELAETLRARSPGLKVLFMSGYTDNAIIQHGLLDPGVAFLQKPFTPDALARKVREVLRPV